MDFDPIVDKNRVAPDGEDHYEPDLLLKAKPVLKWIVPVAATLVIAILFGIGFAAAIHMPRVEGVMEYTPGLITRLYDRNGQVFREYARETRVMLEEGAVPYLLQNAILATEDSKFFQHGGVDAFGVARAALADLRQGRFAEGASTITMQLARMLFLTREKTWRRKIEETLLAVELEKTLSKQQILTLYCNLINLGHGKYGVEAASQFYFNKTVADLTLTEAATLAAIIPRPSVYSPYRKPDTVQRRRDAVLKRMVEEGFIKREEYTAAVAEPLLVVKTRPKKYIGPYFSEEVRRYLEATYGVSGLYERGLQVATTLDLGMQRAAEEALRAGLLRLDHEKGWRGPLLHLEEDELEAQELPSWTGDDPLPGRWYEGIVLAVGRRQAKVKVDTQIYTLTAEGIEWTERSQPRQLLRRGNVAWFRLEAPEADPEGEPVLILEQEPELEGAVVLLESATGAVRALVGGWDFERNQFNRITQAKRQVGSAFKPFVYGAALESGYTAADTLFDAPVVFRGQDNLPNYSPRNFYRKYYGILTLRRGLEKSINVTSVKLLDLVGVDRVIDFARRCGIRSRLPPFPSLALGTADLTPLEFAAAYATIANQGMHVKPYFIERLTTPDGRVLEEQLPQASKAMEPEIAYVLTHLLEGVIDRGTGARVADLDLDLAGKTGTTDGPTDVWFVGFTPRYTLLVWVGYDQQRSIGRNATGANSALPIWRSVITRGLEDGWISSGERLSMPPGVLTMRVEHLTGLLPTTGAERTIPEVFVVGTEPAQEYEPKWATIMSLPWYQQRAFYGIPKEGEKMPEDITDWSLVKEAWEAEAEAEAQ